MHYQLRIIAGQFRGRKLKVLLDPKVRPMPDRVRAALFSILGDAIPERCFFDVFAGSGSVGLEALSRGAKRVVFVEKDARFAAALQAHIRQLQIGDQTQVLQADAYRWADKGAIPDEPVNVFVGPPYIEFDQHFDAIRWLITTLQQKLAPGSVLTIQSDRHFPMDLLPGAGEWDLRTYGRTQLAIWLKPLPPDAHAAT